MRLTSTKPDRVIQRAKLAAAQEEPFNGRVLVTVTGWVEVEDCASEEDAKRQAKAVITRAAKGWMDLDDVDAEDVELL